MTAVMANNLYARNHSMSPAQVKHLNWGNGTVVELYKQPYKPENINSPKCLYAHGERA